MRLVFFFKCYSGSRKLALLLLLLFEKIFPESVKEIFFDRSLIESRSILGFLFDREGVIKSSREAMLIKFRFRERLVAFKLRWGSSDFVVFEQIFIKEEYQQAIQQHFESPWIVDAGANIGCTTVYFKIAYPSAKILAIEADPDNFILLKENLALNDFDDVQSLSAALWFENGTVNISRNFKDGRNWAIHVDDKGQTQVISKTLQTIFKDYSLGSIDILKMDIEGSEQPIFIRDETLPELLGMTKCVAIEVHSENNFIAEKLKQLGFQIFTKGETLFAQKH